MPGNSDRSGAYLAVLKLKSFHKYRGAKEYYNDLRYHDIFGNDCRSNMVFHRYSVGLLFSGSTKKQRRIEIGSE